MEDPPRDNDDYTLLVQLNHKDQHVQHHKSEANARGFDHDLRQSEESQAYLGEQNLSFLRCHKSEADMNARALKKFNLEKLLDQRHTLEKQIALYEQEFGNEIDETEQAQSHVAELEQNLLLVIDELENNHNDLMSNKRKSSLKTSSPVEQKERNHPNSGEKHTTSPSAKVDSFSTCTIGENLRDSLLASLNSKDDDSSYAFLEANTENKSCKRLLSMWNCLEPSIQRVLSLVAKIKSLQKDKEHPRINLHKEEEEVKLLFDENSILDKENRRLSKKYKEKNHSSLGDKLLHSLNSFASSRSPAFTIKTVLFFALSVSLFCLAEAQDFEYFQLVQLWSPTYCKRQVGGKDCLPGVVMEDRFHLHGLWPANPAPLPQPQFCKHTRLFGRGVRVISEQLENEMGVWWPSLTKNNHKFWNSEWQKHGSCSGMGRARYVHQVLNKFQDVDLFVELRNDDILPQDINDQPIEYHDYLTFQNTLGNKFVPMEAGISRIQIRLLCTNNQKELYGVEACTDNRGVYYIDCPNTGSCDVRGFRYLTYSPRPQCKPCVSSKLTVRVPTADRLVAALFFRSALFCFAALFGGITLNESRSGQTISKVTNASSRNALETNGTMPSKRKREGWSEEEENELRAGVQRWGEGNWTRLAKEEYLSKRTKWQEEEDNELPAIIERWGLGNWARLAKEERLSKRTKGQLSQW